MNDQMFSSPVFVKHEDSIIQQISSVEDALEFLYEWPKMQGDAILDKALAACQRAFESDYPRSAAKDAFTDFAKHAGIHEDVDALLPWMITQSDRDGGASR